MFQSSMDVLFCTDAQRARTSPVCSFKGNSGFERWSSIACGTYGALTRGERCSRADALHRVFASDRLEQKLKH
eukprot:3412681-Amphidinium_carterae.2